MALVETGASATPDPATLAATVSSMICGTAPAGPLSAVAYGGSDEGDAGDGWICRLLTSYVLAPSGTAR
jgi:hypothetical protein